MEQHPIPRQITSFEFKLIGFMTLKQFLYLVVFIPIGYIVYRLVPVTIVNVLLGIMAGAVGVLFAFLPINDRPLDFFIKNLVKRLLSPTQYTFQKSNKPVYFLQNLYYLSDPHKVFTHIESQEKLAAYMTKTRKTTAPDALRDKHRATVAAALQNSAATPSPSPSQPATPATPTPVVDTQVAQAQPAPQLQQAQPQNAAPPVSQSAAETHKQPFLIGIVKTRKHLPIPNILIYIKSGSSTLRILKSNPHGVFATYNPLPPHSYQFTFTDPKGEHVFDTMNVHVTDSNNKPLEVISKELL